MLTARVLLVSEIAGIASYVKESQSGVIVKPNVKSVKQGLLKLIEQREKWRKMGLSGRHYVLDHLEWQQVATLALEKYKNID